MEMLEQNKIPYGIEEKALAFCRSHCLFASGDRAVAACSGGADSMALLLFLLAAAGQLGITVEVCHVHHGLRGESADRDAAFVADFCRSRGLRLHAFRAGQQGLPPPPEHPSEDWARRLRYACFDRLTAQGAVVATAHTLNDQAETLLFRLARGTGLHGLAGIPVRRAGLRRPLLCLTRQETEAYCAALGQPYVTDETNLSDAYARNRIRHHALPALQAANPAALGAMGRLCEKMQALDGYFAEKAATLLESAARPAPPGCRAWSLTALAGAEPPVLQWALHSLLADRRDPEEKTIRLLQELVQAGRGGVQVSKNARFLAAQGLLLLQPLPTGELPPPDRPQPFLPGRFRFAGGYCLEVTVEKYDKTEKIQSVHKKDLKYLADYAKIPSSTLFRTRLAGDRFSPWGRGVTKSLKKYMNEQKIPASERACLPLLAKDGRILWMWGQGFAQGLQPDENTVDVVRIREAGKETET